MEDMLTTYTNKVKKELEEEDAFSRKKYNEQKDKIYKWLKGLLPYRFEIEECNSKEQAESLESFKSVEKAPLRSYNFCRIKDLRTGKSMVVKVIENFYLPHIIKSSVLPEWSEYPQWLFFSTCLYIGLTGNKHTDSFVFDNHYIQLETIEHLTISLRVLMRRLGYCISPLTELERFFRGGTKMTERYLAVSKVYSRYVASHLLKRELLDAIEKQNIKRLEK